MSPWIGDGLGRLWSAIQMPVRPSVVFGLLIVLTLSAAPAEEYPSPKEYPSAEEPSSNSPTSKVNWLSRYGQARRESSKLDRPVMLFLTIDGCLHCVRMEHDSFSDDQLAANLNDAFVPARIKTDINSRLARELNVTMFPTTVFIAPDGKILDYIRGYVPRDELRSRMSRVMDASAASVASR